jgi:hypothetical protein
MEVVLSPIILKDGQMGENNLCYAHPNIRNIQAVFESICRFVTYLLGPGAERYTDIMEVHALSPITQPGWTDGKIIFVSCIPNHLRNIPQSNIWRVNMSFRRHLA